MTRLRKGLTTAHRWRSRARLDALFARYPEPPPPAAPQGPPQGQEQGRCAVHKVAMKQTTTNGRSWYSHRTGDGWCTGR